MHEKWYKLTFLTTEVKENEAEKRMLNLKFSLIRLKIKITFNFIHLFFLRVTF